jgi:hypothetical protein
MKFKINVNNGKFFTHSTGEADMVGVELENPLNLEISDAELAELGLQRKPLFKVGDMVRVIGQKEIPHHFNINDICLIVAYKGYYEDYKGCDNIYKVSRHGCFTQSIAHSDLELVEAPQAHEWKVGGFVKYKNGNVSKVIKVWKDAAGNTWVVDKKGMNTPTDHCTPVPKPEMSDFPDGFGLARDYTQDGYLWLASMNMRSPLEAWIGHSQAYPNTISSSPIRAALPQLLALKEWWDTVKEVEGE